MVWTPRPEVRSALKSGQQARGAGQKTRGRPDALTRGEAPLLKQKKKKKKAGGGGGGWGGHVD